MAGNTAAHEQLFEGVTELLQTIRALGARCVILSSALWRGAAEYHKDFEALGLAEYADAFVSSVDVGYRTAPGNVQGGVGQGGCGPSACVMVGNSEANDVAPAVSLGMRALRVAIEEPPPAETTAQALATSLHEAAALLRRWRT
jgi:FMN phosphatase YigB (HAD superfamily)